MVSRCFASYGRNIQAAVAGGVLAFGDRMGGLGEQFAKLMSERLAASGATPAIEDEALGAEARVTVRLLTPPGIPYGQNTRNGFMTQFTPQYQRPVLAGLAQQSRALLICPHT